MRPEATDLHGFLLGFVEGRDRTVGAANAVEHLAYDLAGDDVRYIDLSQGLACYDGRAGKPERGMLNQEELASVGRDALHHTGDHRHCVHDQG